MSRFLWFTVYIQNRPKLYIPHGWSIIFYYINRTRGTVKNEKEKKKIIIIVNNNNNNNNSNETVCREQSTYLRTLRSKFRCRVRRSLLEITHTRSKSAEVKKVSSYFFIFFPQNLITLWSTVTHNHTKSRQILISGLSVFVRTDGLNRNNNMCFAQRSCLADINNNVCAAVITTNSLRRFNRSIQ